MTQTQKKTLRSWRKKYSTSFLAVIVRNLFVTGTKKLSSKIFILPLQKKISENRLENNSTKTLSSRGFIHQPQKNLPIISITCHAETVTKLVKNGLTILPKHYLCEPYKKPVIRCYNCQLFGHSKILH